MLRTRDFILFILAIGFLLLAIGSTISSQKPNASAEPSMKFADVGDADYEAVFNDENTISREERLATMRQKVSESEGVFLTDGIEESEEEPEVLDGLETEDEEVVVNDGPNNCEVFSSYQGNWSANQVKIKEVEGSRVFYTDEEVGVMVASTTGSTTEQVMVTESVETSLLQLPLQPIITTQTNCLATDVVGIATDGSLIKNGEYGLYGIFGETTLIGYALDGWPIYGSTNRELDECGGFADQNGYAYYLGGVESDREEVLHCFVSNPVSI